MKLPKFTPNIRPIEKLRLMDFKEASVSPSTQSAGDLLWSYSDLSPFEERQIDVIFTIAIPPTVDNGSNLSFKATIEPVENDETAINNIFHLNQFAINSIDPNDKTCLQGNEIDVTAKGDYIHYTIRFQNIGTADAINVVVKDILPDQVDWSSFAPVSSSHSNRTDRSDGNRVEFIFEDINLPGKDNEPNSHGFVTFKVRPHYSLVLGSVIHNSADIYFDFNAPIKTNETKTSIVNLVVSTQDEEDLSQIRLYPNPTKNHLVIDTDNDIEISAVTILDLSGKRLFQKLIKDQNKQSTLELNDFSDGIYIIQINTNKGIQNRRFIKME